jgi:hypothetical protein
VAAAVGADLVGALFNELADALVDVVTNRATVGLQWLSGGVADVPVLDADGYLGSISFA